MLIIDAHLDLAYNALFGRDVLCHAAEQRPDAMGIPSVGLPDLHAGNVGLICATIFCEPALNDRPGYRTPDEAHAQATAQLAWYRHQFATGALRLLTTPSGLPPPHNQEPEIKNQDSRIATLLLLEGADAIRTPDDVPLFFNAGIRIVGLAWKRTRYAGGTGAPGPLTPEGVELIKALDAAEIIHDASHLAEESFWQLLDLAAGPVIASHSNCRTIVPTDRQLSDEMIRALVARGGVIGVNLFDKFLVPPDELETRRANLADVVRHIRHICDLIGNANHVGLGSDMDGGFGQQRLPEEIRSSADLFRLADALASARFPDPDIAAILAGNWLQFFHRALPRAPAGDDAVTP